MKAPAKQFSVIAAAVRNAVFVGIGAIALTACVSQGKYDLLAKERDALAQEKITLEQDKTTLEQNVAQERNKLTMTAEELAAIKAKTAEQEAMYSKLKKELSSELDSQKLTLRQLKNGISVDLPEDILFPSGSAVLRDSGREVLAKVSGQLVGTNYEIVVSGFTDNVPISGKLAQRFPTNWDLAAARATNVVRLLEENKVPSGKLIAASYGENKPVADNASEGGRKKNRRIEIHLRPMVQE
jgi:chemotaxis protein MotB